MRTQTKDILIYITFSFLLGACAFGLIGQCEHHPLLNTQSFERDKK